MFIKGAWYSDTKAIDANIQPSIKREISQPELTDIPVSSQAAEMHVFRRKGLCTDYAFARLSPWIKFLRIYLLVSFLFMALPIHF